MFHVRLAHQIHGANATYLLLPEGQPIRLVETPNPRCQWMTIFHSRKEGSEKNREPAFAPWIWCAKCTWKHLPMTSVWIESCVLEVRH